MKISYLKHRDIDKEKWDLCLNRSLNALPYAQSFYLDIVSPGWEALVGGDYEAIFPLTAGSKFGLPYLKHPLFAQQLGLFYTSEVWRITDDFIDHIPGKFKFKLQRLNSKSKPQSHKYTERINYLLDLSVSPAADVRYSENTRRNIKKAADSLCHVKSGIPADDFLALKLSTMVAPLSESDRLMMKQLINELMNRKMANVLGVYHEGRLESAVLFLEWRNRICYLFSASTEKGKQMRASFAIVDYVIRNESGKGKVLDFEGSMDENISRFFKGFGAVRENYYELKKWF